MSRFRESSLVKRFFISRWFLICGFVVALFLAFAYARAYYQDYKIKQEIRQLKEEVRLMERKKLESLDILEYVMSSTFVEEKARTELGMKKPGEQVIILDAGQAKKEPAEAPKEEDRQNFRNPIKWWYYFFH